MEDGRNVFRQEAEENSTEEGGAEENTHPGGTDERGEPETVVGNSGPSWDLWCPAVQEGANVILSASLGTPRALSFSRKLAAATLSILSQFSV